MSMSMATAILYVLVFRSDVIKHLPVYLLEKLFSEELLQWRYAVSLSFSKLYIPYQICAFIYGVNVAYTISFGRFSLSKRLLAVLQLYNCN
jgi:hypothetical protein